MILAKPENRQRLIFFAGIERVRFRRPVHPGDVVVIEARVLRLRSRMGLLKGAARVDGKVVIEGTMTFALGPAGQRGTPEPDLALALAHPCACSRHPCCTFTPDTARTAAVAEWRTAC